MIGPIKYKNLILKYIQKKTCNSLQVGNLVGLLLSNDASCTISQFRYILSYFWRKCIQNFSIRNMISDGLFWTHFDIWNAEAHCLILMRSRSMFLHCIHWIHTVRSKISPKKCQNSFFFQTLPSWRIWPRDTFSSWTFFLSLDDTTISIRGDDFSSFFASSLTKFVNNLFGRQVNKLNFTGKKYLLFLHLHQ